MSNGDTRRVLILIPILHSERDMGSLGPKLPANQEYRRAVEHFWRDVEQRVQAADLDWPRAIVYQDGMPDAGPEIVRKILSEVQSRNYGLLRWLVAQGAQIVGTESPTLLKEEYDCLRAVLLARESSARASAQSAYKARAPGLLAERDAYIAKRIAETLKVGDVGLLFLGRAHSVRGLLPPTISVRDLPPRAA